MTHDDSWVARLPIAEGRAELLEEIMAERNLSVLILRGNCIALPPLDSSRIRYTIRALRGSASSRHTRGEQ